MFLCRKNNGSVRCSHGIDICLQYNGQCRRFLPYTFIHSPPIPQRCSLHVNQFCTQFTGRNLTLRKGSQSLCKRPQRYGTFDQDRRRTRSAYLKDYQPSNFELHRHLLLKGTLSRGVRVVGCGGGENSTTSFFTIRPLFCSRSAPPCRGIICAGTSAT